MHRILFPDPDPGKISHSNYSTSTEQTTRRDCALVLLFTGLKLSDLPIAYRGTPKSCPVTVQVKPFGSIHEERRSLSDFQHNGDRSDFTTIETFAVKRATGHSANHIHFGPHLDVISWLGAVERLEGVVRGVLEDVERVDHFTPVLHAPRLHRFGDIGRARPVVRLILALVKARVTRHVQEIVRLDRVGHEREHPPVTVRVQTLADLGCGQPAQRISRVARGEVFARGAGRVR